MIIIIRCSLAIGQFLIPDSDRHHNKIQMEVQDMSSGLFFLNRKHCRRNGFRRDLKN